MSEKPSLENIAEWAANWADEYGFGYDDHTAILRQFHERVRERLSDAWVEGLIAGHKQHTAQYPNSDGNPYRTEAP